MRACERPAHLNRSVPRPCGFFLPQGRDTTTFNKRQFAPWADTISRHMRASR